MTIIDGFETKEGKKIKVNNLTDIPEKVKKELEKSSATQLDILYIRNTLYIQGKALEKISVSHEAIMEQLTVKVGNGEYEDRPLKDIVYKMWERERGKREYYKVKNIAKRHKKGLGIITLFFLLLGIMFHDFVSIGLHWVGDHIIDLIKIII